MTELLAALLGALVGGGISLWQTSRVLRHDVEQAAAERREAQRQEDERRVTAAADHLLAALADFTTTDRDEADSTAWFVRLPAVAATHAERHGRVVALLRAGAGHAHLLPADVRARWESLVWLARFCHKSMPNRSESLRRRDGGDLRMYAEYVRRCLVALAAGTDSPPQYPPPDPRREAPRVWGFRPEGGALEPDLTAWMTQANGIGELPTTTGGRVWIGPEGRVERIASADES